MHLRSVPNLTVIRPCDANETAEAWKAAAEKGQVGSLLLHMEQPELLPLMADIFLS